MWNLWVLASFNSDISIEEAMKKYKGNGVINRCLLLLGRFDLALLVKSDEFMDTFDNLMNFLTENIYPSDLCYLPGYCYGNCRSPASKNGGNQPNVAGLLMVCSDQQDRISSLCDEFIENDKILAYDVYSTLSFPGSIVYIEAIDPVLIAFVRSQLSKDLNSDITAHLGINIEWGHRHHETYSAAMLVKLKNKDGTKKPNFEEIIRDSPLISPIEFSLRMGWHEYILRIEYNDPIDLINFARKIRASEGILTTATVQYMTCMKMGVEYELHNK
ncbi:MAG: hypothetical protein ACTSP4_03380 [Candidatus Hodarchaeales archaeon]